MINYDLSKIRAVAFDVDGVLSAETVSIDDAGIPMRTVNIKDGYAMQLAVKMGLHLCIITGAKVESVRHRYEGLGIKDVHIGASVKKLVYDEWKAKYGLKDDEIIFVGDDIPDMEVLGSCGCSCCPADACHEVKELCVYISQRKGGFGVARDILEQVMRAQGKWLADKRAFGW